MTKYITQEEALKLGFSKSFSLDDCDMYTWEIGDLTTHIIGHIEYYWDDEYRDEHYLRTMLSKIEIEIVSDRLLYYNLFNPDSVRDYFIERFLDMTYDHFSDHDNLDDDIVVKSFCDIDFEKITDMINSKIKEDKLYPELTPVSDYVIKLTFDEVDEIVNEILGDVD